MRGGRGDRERREGRQREKGGEEREEGGEVRGIKKGRCEEEREREKRREEQLRLIQTYAQSGHVISPALQHVHTQKSEPESDAHCCVSVSMRGVMRALRQACPRQCRAGGVMKKLSANICSCSTT